MASEDGRLRIAKTMFVENGKPLLEIAMDLDINIFTLNKHSLEEGWAGLRAEYSKRMDDARTNDALYVHDAAYSQQLNLIMYLTTCLENSDITRDELYLLRVKMEAASLAADALYKLTTGHRASRGIPRDKASVADTAKVTQGARYTPIIAPAKVKTGTG